MEETPMMATQLQMCRVSTALVRQSGRVVRAADEQAGTMSLRRWQPDLLAISYPCHKIAIVELCWPLNVQLERLQAAYQQKLATYTPLLTALEFYTKAGWDIQILPWVVGARGMVQTDQLHRALQFLDISRNKWSCIIDATVRESVSALVFMHRARFSSLNPTGSSPHPGPTVNVETGAWRGAKRRREDGKGDFGALMARWKKMAEALRR